MKPGFYKTLSSIVVIAFVLFWIASAAFSISTSTPNDTLAKHFPGLSRRFSHTWALFYKNFDANDELTLLLRNKKTGLTDTMNLMSENFSLKAKTAPFNQHYFILDKLLTHYVTVAKVKGQSFQKLINEDTLGKQSLPLLAQKDKAYQTALKTLDNYCRYVLLQKKTDTAGKEYKIMITTTYLKPFEERNDLKYVPKTYTYYQSDYTSF
ncbi:hypothetical protein [Ferruginibacter albus]|uniref:hypothetical protein n=1 Tax=Ferruginibacter albus TaxID=2875540 RepID=UPI001CC3B7E4|nr:hypothetical protein [Ferruginibacter albus]UAY50878.1 hypothetical protein K9M53_09780 [Ferruginibacter albus]